MMIDLSRKRGHNRVLLTLVLSGAAILVPGQAQQFVISTYAGGPSATTPIQALNVAIGSPQGIAADASGNVYFTSLFAGSPAYYHGRYGVFKLDRNGFLTRIAGNSGEGFSGDGGPAINAQFRLSSFSDEPAMPGIAVDYVGNVYIADSGNNRVRKVNRYDGTITTIAGNGTSGYSGDGSLASNAQLVYPSSLAFGGASDIYIASGDRIRRVSYDGTITTATTAEPGSAVAVDGADSLYIAGGGSLRKVSPSGAITSIVDEEGLAMAVDHWENVYLAQGPRVRKIAPDGLIRTVAGNGTCGYSGDGGPATSAQVCANGLAADWEGNLYIADAQSQRLRKISPDGVISTVAGNGACCYSGDGGPASTAQFNLAPWGGGMAVDSGGNLYIADAANHRVRKVSSGRISTVAGNGIQGYSGDFGPATSAELSYPSGVTIDSQGNLYIADVGNQRVRKVSPDGIISTEVEAFGRALAVDKADNLYFADGGGVHRIGPLGTLTTLTTTPLNLPFAAAADNAGNYYAAEIGAHNYRVRKITPDGIITTVAGDGNAGYSGDGGPAANAELNGPVGLAVDGAGNLYIADTFNARIRMVSPSGSIRTIAGNGGPGYSGDGGPATSAQLGSLSGLAIDGAGNLYAGDQYYNAVRLLQPLGSSPVVTGAVNAASNLSGAIAPGELVVFTGFGLGPDQLVLATPDGDGLYPAQVAGTSVLVNGLPAHLISTSATQVAAIVPDSAAVGIGQIVITYQGQASSAFPIPVAPSALGIFTVDSTGRGNAATINQDGLINAPVNWYDTITLFVTGAGHATSGFIKFYPDTSIQIVVPISAGDIHGSVAGVTLIKAPIPYGPICRVPVTVQVGNASSQDGVLLAMGICI
jgi:uncharacterized protein (TIGR03437 family)